MINEVSYQSDDRLRDVEMSLAVHLAECSEKSKRVGDNIEVMKAEVAKMDRNIDKLDAKLTRIGISIGVGIFLSITGVFITKALS